MITTSKKVSATDIDEASIELDILKKQIKELEKQYTKVTAIKRIENIYICTKECNALLTELNEVENELFKIDKKIYKHPMLTSYMLRRDKKIQTEEQYTHFMKKQKETLVEHAFANIKVRVLLNKRNEILNTIDELKQKNCTCK